MRKLVFILAIAVVTLQSCEKSQAKNNGNESQQTSVAVTQTAVQTQQTLGFGKA